MTEVYAGRVAALAEVWRVWAELGAGLSAEQWAAPTRCEGWDVAAVYAHYSVMPLNLSGPLPAQAGLGNPVSAAELLRGFNAPGGTAHTAAQVVADHGVAQAASLSTQDLVDRFAVSGPQAVQQLSTADPDVLVPWPSGAVLRLVEALRVVLLEGTVHLLDVQRALSDEPNIPASALRKTAVLLAEIAPAVDFIEAATGRVTTSPLPVLR